MSSAIPFNIDLLNSPVGEKGPFVPVGAQVPAARPHRLTVAQVEAAIRAGVLTEQDRCELIRGELIDKMVIGDPHVAAVNRLAQFFKRLADDRALVAVQNPIKLRDSRPEPDVAVLQPEPDCYESRTATPPDILLLIEVADSSLEFDRLVKRPLYAENGVQEYWIVNLIDDCIEVHRDPQVSGVYASHRVAVRGESIALLALPELTVPVDAVLSRKRT